MVKKEFIRPSEVADRLGVSRSTIYRWFWEGKLQGVKFSDRNIRILKSSVEKLTSHCW
ncbi:MAG: helix-turn-helix domain-containing protein [Deltaproteobacteria bacterium]|nr:helix-turn-helix domain-containing protein [Deltaproteobacteria bacterium]